MLFAMAGVFTAGAFTDWEPLKPLLRMTCHRLPERSWSWAPGLCARCTFFWIGMTLSLPFMYFRKLPGSVKAGLMMIAPLVLDGTLQYAGLYQSTNWIRLITGLLAGTGICVLLESGARTG